MKLNKDYASIALHNFFFKKSLRLKNETKLHLLMKNKQKKNKTQTHTKLDTKSTTTTCLKLRHQEQVPHQNKMKDIRGEKCYNFFYKTLFWFTTLDKGSGR